MKSHKVIQFLFVILITLFTSAAVQADKDSPLEVIKSRNQTVEKLVESEGEQVDEATREKLKDVINGLMDFRELSRRALGKHWDDRTEQEKKEFVHTFEQLIRNSSVKKLEIYKADRMEYLQPEINGEKAEVTTIAHKERKQVEIIYKMHLVDGEWKVYDMEIDGLSTARNYRDSFYKQIAKSSYDEMYQKLRDRLEEQESEQ